jgi:TolB-like protein/Flp pilus assembly protein TadD
MRLFEELKRRNVFRVGVAYIVATWVVLQVADLVFEAINAPDWVLQALMTMMVMGFFAALIIAWAYEMTPDGIKRESEVDRDRSITSQTAEKLNRITIGLLVLVVAIVIIDRLLPDRDATRAGPAQPAETMVAGAPEIQAMEGPFVVADVDPRQSVAVLPFVNMSDDQQNEYFSDGISEELLNVLVKIESLRVPSRTSSFTFKGSNKKLTDIGRELQVDHVLEGSVRKAGDRIRVTAQLIDVRTDTHLWSDTYTRELDDIFAVQDEISSAIVQALKVTLTGSDQQALATHSTNNVEAYNQYLLGRHLWNQRNPQSLLDATEPLRAAVETDPGFDQAWSALADAYVLIPEYKAGPIKDYIPLAREATQKALEINPASARALTTRAYIRSMYEYDVEGALEDFEKAIELEPAYPTAHQWYGEILAVSRRLDEALEQIRIAKELDPLALVIHHVEGWLLSGDGRYEEAVHSYNNVLKLNPNQANTYGNMTINFAKMGRYEEARQSSHRNAQLGGHDNAPGIAAIDAMENPALVGRAVELLEQSPDYPDGASDNAQLLILMGEEELTLQSLERAFEAGDPYAIHINRMDLYDPIRDSPRFQALLRKMNLLP